MVYKNFLLRLFFSIFFILTYSIFAFINFSLVFYLIIFIYIAIFIEIYLYFKKYKFYLIIYFFISFLFFITIDFSESKFLSFNLFILIVITFDIFSYLIGKTFGKNKLTKISPNKTYEGLLGGAAISFFTFLLFVLFYKITINIELLYFVFIIIFSSFMGDIVESFFKRKNNLKNSSEIIPGHGGFFDRFDSFLFSIIFYSLSTRFLISI